MVVALMLVCWSSVQMDVVKNLVNMIIANSVTHVHVSSNGTQKKYDVYKVR